MLRACKECIDLLVPITNEQMPILNVDVGEVNPWTAICQKMRELDDGTSFSDRASSSVRNRFRKDRSTHTNLYKQALIDKEKTGKGKDITDVEGLPDVYPGHPLNNVLLHEICWYFRERNVRKRGRHSIKPVKVSKVFKQKLRLGFYNSEKVLISSDSKERHRKFF